MNFPSIVLALAATCATAVQAQERERAWWSIAAQPIAAHNHADAAPVTLPNAAWLVGARYAIDSLAPPLARGRAWPQAKRATPQADPAPRRATRVFRIATTSAD